MQNIKFRIVLIVFVAGWVSCLNGSKDKLVKTYSVNDSLHGKIYAVINDTVDFKHIIHSKNGVKKRIFFVKDNLQHGLDVEYFDNGKIASQGYWHQGKKNGKFEYFDSLGSLKTLRYFIQFRDTNIAKLNEVIRFDENGDTLKKESLYCELYKHSDTIQLGQEYLLKVKLTGHLFDKAFLCVCDFDESYRLITTNPCDTILMKDMELVISPNNYVIGRNTIRGVIVNYSDYDVDGKLKSKFAELFFSKDFYVREK